VLTFATNAPVELVLNPIVYVTPVPAAFTLDAEFVTDVTPVAIVKLPVDTAAVSDEVATDTV
jgi:hypothetical protein